MNTTLILTILAFILTAVGVYFLLDMNKLFKQEKIEEEAELMEEATKILEAFTLEASPYDALKQGYNLEETEEKEKAEAKAEAKAEEKAEAQTPEPAPGSAEPPALAPAPVPAPVEAPSPEKMEAEEPKEVAFLKETEQGITGISTHASMPAPFINL